MNTIINILEYMNENKALLIITGFLFITAVWLLSRITLLRRKVRRTKLKKIDAMTGTEFELFLKDLFTVKGYSVKHLGKSGDFGGDLLIRHGTWTEVVQAKRYASNVGVKAIQEVFAAKSYYRARKATVVTNAYFTPAAKKLATKLKVRLVDRADLIQYIKSI